MDRLHELAAKAAAPRNRSVAKAMEGNLRSKGNVRQSPNFVQRDSEIDFVTDRG